MTFIKHAAGALTGLLFTLCTACSGQTNPTPKAAQASALKPSVIVQKKAAAESPFKALNVKVGMERRAVEQYVAKLKGKQCSYRTWGNNLRGGGALYLHDGWSLRVTYKRGELGEMDADAEGKIIGHTPAIDETVTEFKVEKGPLIGDSKRTKINPKDSSWLTPWPGGGKLWCWKSVVVPERFYFEKGDFTICTDRNGKQLWEQKTEGRPLWDFNYDCRAFLTKQKEGITIEWISTKDGKKTVSLNTPTNQQGWDRRFILGKEDGDLIYCWDHGPAVRGRAPLFTHGNLYFYRRGKLVSTWQPMKEGYRMFREVLARKDGGCVVYGEKDNKGLGFARDKDGNRLVFEFDASGRLKGPFPSKDFVSLRPTGIGTFTRGIRGRGFQVYVNKDLFFTKEPMQPNRFTRDASSVTIGKDGVMPAPFTVAWRLPLHEEVWDLTNDQDGVLYVLTSRHVKRRSLWSVAKVSTKERRIIAITQLGSAGSDIMGFGRTIYAHDLEKKDKTVRRILWRHQVF